MKMELLIYCEFTANSRCCVFLCERVFDVLSLKYNSNIGDLIGEAIHSKCSLIARRSTRQPSGTRLTAQDGADTSR